MMPDPKDRKKAAEDLDRVLDPEEDEAEDAYEATYRDGSVRHECWGRED